MRSVLGHVVRGGIVAGALGVLSVNLHCGPRVTRCAPVPDSDDCKDLAMTPAEGDAVDAWLKEEEALKTPADRCAYWSKRAAETPVNRAVDFAGRMRHHACSPAGLHPPATPSGDASTRPGTTADGG